MLQGEQGEWRGLLGLAEHQIDTILKNNQQVT